MNGSLQSRLGGGGDSSQVVALKGEIATLQLKLEMSESEVEDVRAEGVKAVDTANRYAIHNQQSERLRRVEADKRVESLQGSYNRMEDRVRHTRLKLEESQAETLVECASGAPATQRRK